jgi:hypothetical protein
LFLVYLTVAENAGMPDNYRFMMDYEYQDKNKEIYKLKYLVFKIYILSIRFHKKYFSSVNTNTGVVPEL